MQLKVSGISNNYFIPTVDIEIVWQTHLFRSKMYQEDCIHLFVSVINHSLLLIMLIIMIKFLKNVRSTIHLDCMNNDSRKSIVHYY